MGVFDRLSTIVKAHTNKALDALEGDGIAVMEQELVEARKQYATQKVAVAEVKATAKHYQEMYDEHISNADRLHRLAAEQLKAGNEAGAKELLEAEKEERAEAEELKDDVTLFNDRASKAEAQLKKYASQIQDAEKVYNETKVNVKVAKATEAVSEGAFDDSALNKFNRHAEKARARYETAQAVQEMEGESSTADDLFEKYGASESDADLEDLKKELGL